MVIADVVRVRIPVGGETVTLVCRRPSAAELSGFLSARFETRGRKVKSHLYEARTALIDKILVDAEGAEFQDAANEVRPLNAATTLTEEDRRKWSGILGAKVEAWRDLIPVSWKSSAAMTFEDSQADDEEGN